ncbi:MAG: hypothetical protein M1820_009504 [Bogoriella megaspora]|nr:MAG: hypothetical protein M1820_009504 [Bogoriella megaspora]
MCYIEITEFDACEHKNEAVKTCPFALCANMPSKTTLVGWACESCRQQEQKETVKQYRNSIGRLIGEYEDDQGHGHSTEPIKEQMRVLQKTTKEHLKSLNVDKPYEGLSMWSKLKMMATSSRRYPKDLVAREKEPLLGESE